MAVEYKKSEIHKDRSGLKTRKEKKLILEMKHIKECLLDELTEKCHSCHVVSFLS